MSSFSRAYLALVGTVLLVIVALMSSDAHIQEAVHPSNTAFATAELVAATAVLALASFAFVLAFLPSYFHWFSMKALVVAMTSSAILTVALVGAYRWFGFPLV